MNVTELIDLINQLGLDSDYITDHQRELYLQYLNMANMELFPIVAKGLKTITNKVDIFLDAASQSFLLPADLFYIRAVWSDKTKLTMIDIDKDISLSEKGYLVLGNTIFCNLSTSGLNFPLKVDPIDNTLKMYITLFYVSNPKTLVENVNDPLTEINTPIYPVPYHHFLAHGALYYFYFADKVFLDKMVFIKDRWDQDKIELTNFKNYGL
jgi:hypothetical protein